MQQVLLNESVAARRRIVMMMIDAADGYSKVTGVAAPTIVVSIDGAAPAAAAGTWTEIANGQYYYELDATEIAALGFVTVNVQEAGCQDADAVVQITANDPYELLQQISRVVHGRPCLFVDATNGDDGYGGGCPTDALATIGAAVAAASDGEIIFVGPGTYSELVNASALDWLTIHYHRGAIHTSAGATLRVGMGAKVTGGGEVISTGAGSSYGAILALTADDVTVCGCAGEMLRATGWNGYGIAMAACNRTQIHHCIISGSEYGVSHWHPAEVVDALIEDCIIRTGNWTTCSTLGIYAVNIDGLTVRNTRVYADRANNNADERPLALWVENCPNAWVDDCFLESEVPAGYGIGIYSYDSETRVLDCHVKTTDHASSYDLQEAGTTGSVSVGQTSYDPDKTSGTIVDLDQRAMDAVDDYADSVETGVTRRQYRRACGAILAGLLSGAGTGGETFLGLDGATTRVVVTVDASGNRSNVVLTL